MTRAARWLHEPLVHFIILGTAVFGLHRWVVPPAPTNRIVLSEAVLRGLRQDHLRRNGSLPTPDEDAALVQQFIDNEVLYREALALGLDRGDIIVRRRLVQKMEFLTEGIEPLPEPTDAELQAYLDTHAARYALADRIALTHVFAGTDRHAADAQPLATEWHALLLTGADAATLGDPFLRGRDLPLSTEAELAGIFGPTFAHGTMALPLEQWSPPLRSSYGWHLARVTARVPGHSPTLADARTAVRRDWFEQRRAEANRAALARLRRRYDIRIEDAGLAARSLRQPGEG